MQKDSRKELERFLHSFSDFFRAYRSLFSYFYDEKDIAEFIPFMTLSSERILEESQDSFPYILPFTCSSSPCSISSLVENAREPVYKNRPKIKEDGTTVAVNKSGHVFLIPPKGSVSAGVIKSSRGDEFPLPSAGVNKDQPLPDEVTSCFRSYLINAFPVRKCIKKLPRILMELFLLIEETADLDTFQQIMEGIGLLSEKQGAVKVRVQNLLKTKSILSKSGFGSTQYAITESGMRDVPKFFSENEPVFAPLGIRIPDDLPALCEEAYRLLSSTAGFRSRRGRPLHDIRETRVYARLLLSPSGCGPEPLELSIEDGMLPEDRPNFKQRFQGNVAGVYADLTETISLNQVNADAAGKPGSGKPTALRRFYSKRVLAYEIDNGTEQLELPPNSRLRQKELDARQKALAIDYNGKRAYSGDNAIDEAGTVSGKVRNFARIFSREDILGDVIFLPFATLEEHRAALFPKKNAAAGSRNAAAAAAPVLPRDALFLRTTAFSEKWRDIPAKVLLRGYYLAACSFAIKNFQDGFPDGSIADNISCAELLRYFAEIEDSLAPFSDDGEAAAVSAEDAFAPDMDPVRAVKEMREILSDYIHHFGGKTLQDKSRKPLSDFFRFVKELSGDQRESAPENALEAEGKGKDAGASRGGFSSRSRALNMLRVLLKGSASSEIRLALLRGMSVSAVFPSRISELFFVAPERWFGKRGVEAAVRNLGIMEENGSGSGSAVLSYHTPLILDRGEAKHTTRLCLWNDDIRIAVENISADIGGFVRARNYISSFPAGSGRNTVMLMLVSDSLILADGSSLLDGTMSRDLDNRGVRYANTCRHTEDGTPYAEMNYYYEAAGRIVGQLSEDVCDVIGGDSKERFFKYVPFLRGVDRDYVMVTYSDFMKAALGEKIQPYTIFSGKKVFVREGDFDENSLPVPYRASAGTARSHDHDMSALLVPGG